MPALVDLAAMRDAMKCLGADPSRINPVCPVDLVIDHSVQVDSYGGYVLQQFLKNYLETRDLYALLMSKM